MKHIILIADGAAGYPVDELGGRTCLQSARKPLIDSLAEKGRCGLLRTIPENFSTGSAVANLSILGYEPLKYFHGRGVLEAAAMGISLEDRDIALRCNIICAENGKIKNHSAGHISSSEAALLIKTLNSRLANEEINFYPGVSYRHLLVLKNRFSSLIECYPPHDNLEKPINDILVYPKEKKGEETAAFLNNLIMKSKEILENHPVNLHREKQGKDKANMIWPWSAGRKPHMKTFNERFGIKGAVITAVDLIKGLGIYCGFDVIPLKRATGLYNTDYEEKAASCIQALKTHDFVYVHVEAPDEAGHAGDFKLKIKCIEDFDRRLVKNIMKKIDMDDTAVAILPDHPTPVMTRAHAADPVPFIIYKPGVAGDGVKKFDEESCCGGYYNILKGINFIEEFLKN
jgi:2,3-bisphosphoglycerate-independent phosphoglycerate mutase